MEDYRKYYLSNLEAYLLEQVRPNFIRIGFLSASEFFCIVIWKANRAKSKIARKLLRDSSCKNLDEAVRKLTEDMAEAGTAESRLRVLVGKWRFALPMASAILTILYPEEFTIYDVRVAGIIDEENQTRLLHVGNRTAFANLWSGYREYMDLVERSAPTALSLRDKDRHLWGKSFFLQLQKDIQENFSNQRLEAD
jgi:hypothetical protein